MNHRLYLIEGLPCSGKSTTSAFVADLLKGDHAVCVVDEGSGNHPADFEFHAFLSESDMECFSQEEREVIVKLAEEMKNGHIIPLSQFSGELFDKLLQYKIYDFLPWETEMPIMLEKWQNFCDHADRNKVYVFNCVLLQNPMCETMMRFDFAEKQSEAYIRAISEIISDMEPVVIYLRNDDIAASVRNAAKEREGWLEAVINYHIGSLYGKRIHAVGFDGYIRCLEERQRRELQILSSLPIKHIIIDNPQRDWHCAYEQIRQFILQL